MSEGSGLVNARPGIPAVPGRFLQRTRICWEKLGIPAQLTVPTGFNPGKGGVNPAAP